MKSEEGAPPSGVLTPEQRAQAAWDAWCTSPEWRPDSNGDAAVALFATAIREDRAAMRETLRSVVRAVEGCCSCVVFSEERGEYVTQNGDVLPGVAAALSDSPPASAASLSASRAKPKERS